MALQASKLSANVAAACRRTPWASPRRILCSQAQADHDQADLGARFNELTNLADGRLGAEILFATDEWFATASNLLNSSPPVFDPDAFCSQGKVMDGWESRRRREPGHDWSIIRLALSGYVHGIEIDTAYFTGNQVLHGARALHTTSVRGEAHGTRMTSISDARLDFFKV